MSSEEEEEEGESSLQRDDFISCTLTIVFEGSGENSGIYKQMCTNARDKHEDNLYFFFSFSLDDVLTLSSRSHVQGDFFFLPLLGKLLHDE